MKKLFQIVFKLIKWILILLGLVVLLIIIFAQRVDESSSNEKSIETITESKKEISENQKIEQKIQREKEEYEKSVLLKRSATPEEVAKTVMWFVNCPHLVTGENVFVDAGLHLQS